MKKVTISLLVLIIILVIILCFTIYILNIMKKNDWVGLYLDCQAQLKYLSETETKKQLEWLWYNNLNITKSEVEEKWVIWLQYYIEIMNNTNKRISFFWVEQVLPANVIRETIYSSDKSFWLNIDVWEKHTTYQYLFINKTEWFSNLWMLDSINLLYSSSANNNGKKLYEICQINKD